MPSLLQIQEPGATPEPGADDGSIAAGIDLGTTNSVIAVSGNGAPEVLREEDGTGLVPSVVAYAPDGSAIVGELARRLLLDRPEVVVSSVKRLMGRSAGDLKALAGTLPYEVAAGSDESGKMVRVEAAGRTLTPIEISADILAR